MRTKLNSDPQNLIKQTTLQNDSPTKKAETAIQYNLDVSPDSEWILVHSTRKAQETMLYVQETGEFFAEKNYFTERRQVNSFLIKIVLDGEGILKYEGKEYHVKTDDFFWIDCRKPHYYATAPSADAWHVIWIHFVGGCAESYYRTFMDMNHQSPVSTMNKSAVSIQLIHNIISLYLRSRNDICADIQAAAFVTNLLSECLIETIHNTTPALSRTPPELICRVYNYINDHYTEKLTLETLAAEFFNNKFYIQKQFRRYIGQSPCEYQNELRINTAKELLRKTNLSVNTIAADVGFESTSYFIHLFKKRESLTPLQYRNYWIYNGG